MNRRGFMTAAALGLGAPWTGMAALQERSGKADSDLKPYRVVSGVSGAARSVGSETLNNLMGFWAERFKTFYPDVSIQIEGKGSATAAQALTSGSAQFGPMSRAMTPDETDAFKSKFGYAPTQIRTAVDALGVFVNRDNPLKSLTLEEVDAIFSKNRRRGALKEVVTWGQLGLSGDWADKPIRTFGRFAASGTYVFFKERVLQDGDFRTAVEQLPGAAAVVESVGRERYAIGYGGIGYASPSVRAVSIAEKPGSTPLEASAENAVSGSYPLSRFLYLYVNRRPGTPLDPLVREFIRMICSREGQEDVLKDGFFPLPASIAQEELKKLD